MNLTAPANTQIACSSDKECPAQTQCRTTVGRCVATSSLTQTNPTLAAPATLTPAVGTVGTTFTLSFKVTDLLFEVPKVALGDSADVFMFDAAASAPEKNAFVFHYVATGGESVGAHTVAISITSGTGAQAVLVAPTLVLDFAAPAVQPAAVAETTSSATLTFTKAINRDQAEHIDNFAITPALQIVAASLGSDNQTVTLVTAPQTPGVNYTVTTSGISDSVGNAILPGSTATFVGFGIPADTSAPTPVTPASGSRVFSAQATLTWTGRFGAANYQVELARDAGFTQPVSGSPFAVAAPVTSLTVPLANAVTYYWRVHADTTTDVAYPVAFFDAMDDAVYVYCPSTAATCNDSGRVGNKSKPFQTLSHALSDAVGDGIALVRVATRNVLPGDDFAYKEIVTLISGVSITGGYASDFATAPDPVAHKTTVSSGTSTYTLVAVGLTAPVTVDGLHIVGASVGPDQGTTYGLYVASCAENLTVQHCTIEGGNVSYPTGTEAVFTTSSGGLYKNNTIRGGAENGSGSNHSFYIVGGAPTLQQNTILVGASPTGATSTATGIRVESAQVILDGNVITGPAGPGAATNLLLDLSSATALLNGNTIIDTHAQYASKAISASTTTLTLTNNVIVSGVTPSPAFAIYYTSNAIDASYSSVLATNNLIAAGVSSVSTAFNTANGGGFAPLSELTNNIILSLGGIHRTCVFEHGVTPPGGTDSVQNNLFIECPEATYIHYDAASSACTPLATSTSKYDCYVSETELNTPSDFGSSTAGTFAGNLTNESVADLATVGFANVSTNDYHLTAATPALVRNAGKDASQDTCGGSLSGTCGAVTKDREGVLRSCPGTHCYSLGPYELH